MKKLMMIFLMFTGGLSLPPSALAVGTIGNDQIMPYRTGFRNYVKNPSGTNKNKNYVTGTSTPVAVVAFESGVGYKIDGIGSISCDSPSIDGACSWSMDTIEDSDRTGNCVLSGVYKGDATKYRFRLYDGLGTTLATTALLGNASDWTTFEVYSPCASVPVGARLYQTESGDGGKVYVGRLNYSKTSSPVVGNQGLYLGRASWAPASNCSRTTSGNNTYNSFGVDPDCADPTVTGAVQAPTTKIPAVRLTGGPGAYKFTASGTFRANTANRSCGFHFYDGTTRTPLQAATVSSTTGTPGQISGIINYTDAPTNKEIVFATYNENGGTTDCNLFNQSVGQDFAIDVEYMPTISQQIFQPQIAADMVKFSIGGADVSLPTGSQTDVDLANGSLTLTNYTGYNQAEIACASGTSSSGTTCTAANEVLGWAFTPMVTGLWRFCPMVPLAINMSSTTTQPTIRINKTANNSSTVSTGGIVKTQLSQNSNLDIRTNMWCEDFNLTQGTKETFRVQYTGNVSSYTTGQVYANNNSAPMVVIGWPLNVQTPVPWFIGGISSNSTGYLRMEGANVTCSSGSTINSQTSTWISAIGNISSSTCAITWPSGTWSSAPYCWLSFSAAGASSWTLQKSVGPTTTGMTLAAYAASTGGNLTSYSVDILCLGMR